MRMGHFQFGLTSNGHIFRKIAINLLRIRCNGRFIEAYKWLLNIIDSRHMSGRRIRIVLNRGTAIDNILWIEFIVLREKFDNLHLSAGLIAFSFSNRMHDRWIAWRWCIRRWSICVGCRGLRGSGCVGSCCWCSGCRFCRRWRSRCRCRRRGRGSGCRSGGGGSRCCRSCRWNWSRFKWSYYERFNVVRTILVLEMIHGEHFIRLANVLAIDEPICCHICGIRQTRSIGRIDFNRLIQWSGTRNVICFAFCAILRKR